MNYFPETGHTLIVLANIDFAADKVTRKFRKLLTGKKEQQAATVSEKVLKQLVGIYQFNEGPLKGGKIQISIKESNLLVQEIGNPSGTYIYLPISDNEFFLEEHENSRLVFTLKDNEVIGFQVDMSPSENFKAIKMD